MTRVAAAPAMLSQNTCEHVSLTKRQYLDAAKVFATDGGVVVPLGKLRMVKTEAMASAWCRCAINCMAACAGDCWCC